MSKSNWHNMPILESWCVLIGYLWCTLYSALYILQCTVHCTMYFPMYNTLSIVQCTVHCTMFCPLYMMYYPLYNVLSRVQCTVHCTLSCPLYNVLSIVQCSLNSHLTLSHTHLTQRTVLAPHNLRIYRLKRNKDTMFSTPALYQGQLWCVCERGWDI